MGTGQSGAEMRARARPAKGAGHSLAVPLAASEWLHRLEVAAEESAGQKGGGTVCTAPREERKLVAAEAAALLLLRAVARGKAPLSLLGEPGAAEAPCRAGAVGITQPS